jgi:hypothetical protein
MAAEVVKSHQNKLKRHRELRHQRCRGALCRDHVFIASNLDTDGIIFKDKLAEEHHDASSCALLTAAGQAEQEHCQDDKGHTNVNLVSLNNE